MSDNKRFSRIRYKDAYIFVSLGVICILISILMHIVHIFETSSEFLLFLQELFVQICSHLGIGFIAIGIITVMLDMNHWTHYFEKRLSKIVTEKEYLEKLDAEALTNLQTEVLKAYFKNDQIGGTGGFLNHYQKNIQGIIGMPYRTTVVMNFQISYENATRERLNIVETLSYKCMSNSGKIQENVCYLPDRAEHYQILNFDLNLQHESFKDKEGDAAGNINFDTKKLQAIKACGPDLDDGLNIDIKAYNQNLLNIVIKTNFVINKDRFIAWRMSYPSESVTMTVSFPPDLRFVKELFFNENDSFTEHLDSLNGYYYLSLHDWLLPEEGIAFQLINDSKLLPAGKS